MTAQLEVLSPIGSLGDVVDESELARLLGYPEGHEPEDQALDLAKEARRWYAGHGRPWSAARRLAVLALDADSLDVDGGESLQSRRLAERLRSAEATEVVVAASTAGFEVDERSAALWSGDRPDEAYFADRFGAAAVEHLAAETAVRLRNRFARDGLGLLPGYSPGYDGWSLTDQLPLFRLLGLDGLLGLDDRVELPGPLEILESGMLRPKNSLLAVFGVTPRIDLADGQWERHRCSWCSLSPCALRRVSPGNVSR